MLTDAEVLWLIGDGRLSFFCLKFVLYFDTCTGPGDSCLMDGVCNSSLTFLPLSSNTMFME